MKKIVMMLVVVLVVAGCNKEKVYKDNLNGEWTLYKYLLYNTDKTSVFQSRYPNYTITFSDAGTFSEFYTNPDSVNISGTYSFEDNLEKIVLENQYLDLSDSTTKTLKREFTIFNLTKTHVQLRNDTSQLYLSKTPE